MILNKCIIRNVFLIIIFHSCGINVSAQNQTVLIFDPYQVSNNFQVTFHQLSSDSIYIVDSLDENINNFDALFLFIGYAYVLSEEEGNRLIEYLNLNKPIYIFVQDIKQFTYWNYVGVTNFGYLPLLTTVDRVTGVDGRFTENIVIDTSFISGSIPGVEGNITPILTGVSDSSFSLTTTYVPVDESIQVIIDFYNLIHHSEFLERVLIYFGLEDPSGITEEILFNPNDFYLAQNYPNPFNPSTTIKFTIPAVEPVHAPSVRLVVYDVLGNEIATLVNEEKPAGSYEVEFSVGQNSILSLSSGVYFYTLSAGNFRETKKMILMK